MTISFNTIPSNTLVPLFYAEMDNQAANTAQDSGASLLIGHASNGAEIVANSLVLMPSADYARQICGAGSQLARMVEAYRQTDPFGELYVIAVPEATGAAATVTLTVTGEATESGTVNVYVGRTRVQAPVTNGDNVTTIASSIKDAINAVPALPFTASSSAGVVTLTARHKGLCGNEIPVSLNYYGFGGGEVLPAGVQIAVATGTAGTGAPVLTGAVAAMADEPFDYIGLPFNDTASVNTLVTEMNDTSGRWSYARQLYGHVYTAKIGTLSELVTAGDQFNQQHITLAGYEKETQTPADELAASRTARAAVFIRNDPARPTQTGELVGMLPAPKGKRFTMTEQQTLLSHGVATAYVESGVLRIQRDVTTYRKNAYGVADNSYLDSETLHTSAYVLRKLKSVITSKYGRHKLASDGTLTGGFDTEELETWRARVIERYYWTPQGGADGDYVVWAKEVPGITRAWTYRHWMGTGTVGVMIASSDLINPIPEESTETAARQHIWPLAPVAGSDLYVFRPVAHKVDFHIRVTPDTPEIRAAITAELRSFLLRDGYPQGELKVSRISEAISGANGEYSHQLLAPADNISIAKNELAVLGTISWT